MLEHAVIVQLFLIYFVKVALKYLMPFKKVKERYDYISQPENKILSYILTQFYF